MSEYQSGLSAAKKAFETLELDALVHEANRERSKFVAAAFAGLWGKVKGLFSSTDKAANLDCSANSEISSNADERYDLDALVRQANIERSKVLGTVFASLWSLVKGLFSSPYKAAKRYYLLQNEIANVDDRVLSDIGVSRWELSGLVRGAIGSNADAKRAAKATKSATILPLFSLMRAEAGRKERENSDHPMAA